MSSQSESPSSPPVRAVRERLDRVTDPELDESIIALEYVDRIDVDDYAVTVEFTLPTAWCSPAFAWMMATDARDEVEALPGVERATVRLRDHMHAEEITEGVNERRSFEATFPDADGGVAAVRRTLDQKARTARQYEAVEALREAGLSDRQIAALQFDDLHLDDPPAVFVRDGSIGVPVPTAALGSYLEKARETGIVDDEHPAVFRTPEGDPISADDFERVHHRSRLAGVNQGGQGTVCDALNAARRGRDQPDSMWD